MLNQLAASIRQGRAYQREGAPSQVGEASKGQLSSFHNYRGKGDIIQSSKWSPDD